MNRSDSALGITFMPNWRDAAPCGDFVQLYESDSALIEPLGDYVHGALQRGQGVVVIATNEHWQELQGRWSRDGVEYAARRDQQQLVFLDAVQLLQGFMLDDEPDRERFFEIVGAPIAEVRRRHGAAVVFSEMVAVLWKQGADHAAVQLDELWYALGQRQEFTRFSAYPLREYATEIAENGAAGAEQALMIPPGDYSPLAMRVIGYLQHKASVLRHEIERSRLAEHDAALLAAIVASSEDAIVTKTLDGRIRTWNVAAERIFGYSAAEAVGQPVTLLIPRELHAEEREILSKLRRGERIEPFETVRLTKDGRRIHVSLSVSPIRNARGEIVAAAKTARDISGRKEVENALRRNEEKLREAHRQKDEFLATLAHELRNPLAPIRYAVAAMRKGGLSAEQREHSQDIIERQLEHMSRLLDDLLDISRVTHRTLTLKKRRLELAAVVVAATETARPKFDAKRHTLVLDLPRQPVELDADPVRLAQIFSNLLVNAAKYTNPGGRIELRATREHGCVVVAVKDNGIGIAPEMIPNLFTLFSQANSALERSEGGLGIGLALVRGLVELHGGSVEARSDGIDRGSEFVVRLPMAVPMPERAAQLPEREAASAPPLNVLVADDNRDGADSCATLLQLSGHTVKTAYNGRQALETAEQFRPDAALLDIGMPELNGYEVARRIRTTHWGGAMVLIAITGWGQEEDRQRALAAGFDYHLAKPIDPNQLDSLLRSIGTAQPRP